MKKKKIDKFFFSIILILLFLGLAIFTSATFGILARNPKTFYSILTSQLVLGLGFGLFGMFLAYKIDYKKWRKYSFYLFFFSILLTLAVFIPKLGWGHGGAKRWLSLGPIGSLQPVEILKFSFIIYLAAWLSWVKNKAQKIKFGILPFLIMLSVIGLILFKQPDTKSFILIAITGLVMIYIAGIPLKQIIGLILILGIVLSVLIFSTPYLQKRIKTFINPAHDSLGSSYQIQQSMIAFGSGNIFGRGYGKSIQKFNYLPEPHGDSIFAIAGEELGFLGSLFIIVLYLMFALRGLRIANRSPDLFSRLLVSGIVILIITQSFMNMGSITGVLPLTGVPLVFMSHGGTSLMIYLIALGIILQISKYQKK